MHSTTYTFTYKFTETDQVEQTDTYTIYAAPTNTAWKEYHYAFYDSEDNKLPIHLDVYQKQNDTLVLYDRIIPYSDFEGTFYEPLENELYFKVYLKPCQMTMFRLYLVGELTVR